MLAVFSRPSRAAAASLCRPKAVDDPAAAEAEPAGDEVDSGSPGDHPDHVGRLGSETGLRYPSIAVLLQHDVECHGGWYYGREPKRMHPKSTDQKTDQHDRISWARNARGTPCDKTCDIFVARAGFCRMTFPLRFT
jgi:hypothetical protein